jgi:hypothetical protein
MAQLDTFGGRIRTFEDLARVSDEVLRQLAARVHIIDLAYAFATADEELKARLLRSVRPRLAEEIESAMRAVMSQTAPPGASGPSDVQVRSARARVMEVAQSTLLSEGE